MFMPEIPVEIKKWFADQGVGSYNLVEYNPRKGRWCLSFVDKDNRRLFLKWNENDEQHIAFYNSMEMEEHIYKCLRKSGITPKYYGGGQFVTECISNPKTLREVIKELINYNDDSALYRVVIRSLDKWQDYIASSNIDFLFLCDPKCEYDRYLYSTLLACPMNTIMGPNEKKRNGYIFKIIKKLLNNKISKLVNDEQLVLKKTHGDFHLNNIMIDDKGDLYLIDFEDSKICLPEIELAYFMSQVLILLRKKNQVKFMINKYVDDSIVVLSDKKLYRKILRLFNFTIQFNTAFQ